MSPTTTPSRPLVGNRRGAALLMALLVSIAIAAMALGAVLLASNAELTTAMTARDATLQAAANGGLAIIRDSINHGSYDSLLPDSGFTTLASDAPVLDASGKAIPGVKRSLYVGRTGGRTGGAATAGQYGTNFASALSVVSDQRGNGAVRRLLMTQDSWSKYAVAINNWNSGTNYGCNESIDGPVYSNNRIVLQGGCGPGSGTLFGGPVHAVTTIVNQASGRYTEGVEVGASPLPWPTIARIDLMEQYAQDADIAGGDYDITSPCGTTGLTSPAVRIEFVPIDVNGDGQIEWDEGFMRVWFAHATTCASATDSTLAYATGRRWLTVPAGVTQTDDRNMISPNCGAVRKVGADSVFHTAAYVWDAYSNPDSVRALLTSPSRRCFLGGDPHLFPLLTADTLTPDSLVTDAPGVALGWWRHRRAGPWSTLSGVRSGDGSYLIPLGANPDFKGVIFVNGDVALSGQLRGRVTVVSTGNIVLADDLLYTLPPGTECTTQGDMLGAIAIKDAVIEDNAVQTPFRVGGKVYGGFDDTGDANYNMFIMAVGSGSADGDWIGEGVFPPFNYYYYIELGNEPPSPNANWDISALNQRCGTAINGCVRVTGGLAEGRMDGATFYSPNHYGWAEAHTYDRCGTVDPPPYFPTTGRFSENRYYELDPVWLKQLTIAEYFKKLQAQ
jgi:hypothetical protein